VGKEDEEEEREGSGREAGSLGISIIQSMIFI
jgi:hypothetical protein